MFDDKFNRVLAILNDLGKADKEIFSALKTVRQNNPKEAKTLARHLFTDILVPRVGNMFAYRDFLSRNANNGIHLSLDANSFGSINKEHGFEKGNEAITKMFNTISDVGRKYGLKSFRSGGDEARLYAPTPERANGFINELKEKLAALPKVAGRHQISASIGVGYTPEHAEKALILAKDQLGPLVEGKRQKIGKPGEEPTVFYSLLHEQPPSTWRPASGKIPEVGSNREAVTPPGLKLSNPLKVA